MIHTPIVFLILLSQASTGTETFPADPIDSAWTSSTTTEDAADAAITDSVVAAIQSDEVLRYYAANCQVSARGAIVMLSGTVPTDTIRQRTAQVARAVSGVGLVVNLVNAEPSRTARARPEPPGVSEAGGSSDAAITGAVFAAIQGDGSLRYDIENIQVSTNRGIVSLTGTVSRDANRQRMAQVAHAVASVVRVVNLVRVAP
jgi:osmotically-inducible protein OsmY